MTLKNAASNKTLATYGSTTKIFDGEDNTSYIEVGGGSIDIVSGSVTQSRFDSSGIIVGPSDNSLSALRVDTSGNLTIGTANTTNFTVTNAGSITMAGGLNATHVNATSGSIGGWTIGADALTGGVVTLNSSGSIEVGSLANATTTATTNSGFFADSSGNVLIKGNVSGNDYMKISAGGGIDIKAQNFDLNTTDLRIENATPKIRVGPASGGSRIELDGSSSELTFYSGSGGFEVLKLDEKATYTYYDPSTASSITNTGPEVRMQNGGSMISIGSHATNLSLHQIMGFNTEQAFFSGGRNGSLINVRNDFNSGYVRGIYSSATDRGTIGTPSTTSVIGINSDADSSTSGVNSYGISAVGKNSNSSNSTGDVFGGNFSAVVHASQTNNDVFGVYAKIVNTSAVTYTTKGSAVKGVGGKYAIHGVGAGTYQGYFEGAVAATGNIIAFTSSDKRLKKNIINIENPIDKIKKLNGVSFEWKHEIDETVMNKTNLGVIAQEVQKVLPEIVKERDDGYLAIKYEQIVPVLIEGIKEQQKQIDELKQKLEEL